jgi:AcrR family transcriptional regulator
MKAPGAHKSSYHHGDLRAALIRAGLALLQERDADDLGLREVARAVGVSAASVYRHFPNKEALLRALAAEGLKRLGEAQRAASEAAGGGIAGFAQQDKLMSRSRSPIRRCSGSSSRVRSQNPKADLRRKKMRLPNSSWSLRHRWRAAPARKKRA